MAMFKLETTAVVYSQEQWKYGVETTFRFKTGLTSEIWSPTNWKFRVERTIKFKVETTEQELKEGTLVVFPIFIWTTSENWREARKSNCERRSNRRKDVRVRTKNFDGDDFSMPSHQNVITFQRFMWWFFQ